MQPITTTSNGAETWPGDVLGRKKTADFLTNYLASRFASRGKEDSGFTIAIDAEWGFGKTFLLKNWEQELISAGHPTVYFDAWKNDHSLDPLVGFIAEINAAFRPLFSNKVQAETRWKDSLRYAKKLIRPIGVTALEVAVKKVTNYSLEELLDKTTGVTEAGNASDGERKLDDAEKILTKAFEEVLKDHQSKNEAIESFRTSLATLVDNIEEEKTLKLPIMILIDELDRCRPSYAIELLECIKHLFGVRGIYFVIALNVAQLSESVKAVYGGGFHARKYLKRFFDAEYSLPEPDNFSFAKHLFAQTTAFHKEKFPSGLHPRIYGDIDLLPRLWSIYSDAFSISLRDQQQVFQVCEAVSSSIPARQAHPHYLFLLVMLRHASPEIFNALFSSAEPPSRETFTAELGKVLKNGAGIETFRASISSLETTKILISSIAWQYIEVAHKNAPDMHAFVANTNPHDFPKTLLFPLAEEAPNPWSPSAFYPLSILSYPEMVKQAGHLFSTTS